jgi:hypothetical protein
MDIWIIILVFVSLAGYILFNFFGSKSEQPKKSDETEEEPEDDNKCDKCGKSYSEDCFGCSECGDSSICEECMLPTDNI